MKAITPRYVSETLQSRAIYPSSRQSWFIFLLVLTKALQCFGIFLVCDLMRTASAVSLVCFSKCVAGCTFVYLQRRQGLKQLTRAQVLRLSQYVVVSLAVTTVSYYGMSLCGPFRSVLLLQHHDFAVLNGVAGLLSAGAAARPAIFRGSVLFILAVLTLIFLDHDESTTHPEVNHPFSGLGSWLGLADHKIGVLLLTLLLVLRTGVNVFGKRVAQDVGGGPRNLHALATLTEGVVLVPWTLVSLCTQEPQSQLSLSLASSLLLPALVSTVFTLVLPYFADSACSQRLEVSRVARIGSVASFACALVIAVLWNDTSAPEDTADAVAYHSLSGGSILACTLFTFGAVSLTSACKQGAKGSFVGYSSAGLPLYNLTTSGGGGGGALHDRSRSVLLLASAVLKQVLGDVDSRRIFYFLCLNLSFTVIEFLYGIWTNSLGLISDGFHMLFDCSALIMGLLASVMARWKPSRTFSYGYGRVEDLSGFINGLFLLVISLFVFSKAVGRLLEPPAINTQRLLFVSALGLVVNLVGIFAFSRHGGSSSHGHGHGGGFHTHSHNANMQGVFLHIMADTLGSVGVIVSSVLIQQLGWFVADPLCSIFIAVLIFVSVLPLLQQSAMVLLLSAPNHADVSTRISGVEGVKSLRKLLTWRHSSSVAMGNVHVEVEQHASEQSVVQQVGSVLKQAGIHQFCVQVEKEELYRHMAGLSWHLKDSSSVSSSAVQL